MSVSVVVPVYNGAGILPTTVPALLALEGVDEWVWVDDGSTDGSVEVLTRMLDGEDHVTVCRQPGNTGRAAARNRGIEEVNGSRIVFFDCDVRPPPDAAVKLVAALGDTGVASVASIQPMLGVRRDPYATYLARHPRGPGPRPPASPIEWKYFLAGACAVLASAFEEVGTFNPSVLYGEDFELACRLAKLDPMGLRSAQTTVDLFEIGDLSGAVVNVQEFGEALSRVAEEHPNALQLAGVQSAVESKVFRWLSAIPVPSDADRVLKWLPRSIQARAVRYLLGHALLAAYHGALDYDP